MKRISLGLVLLVMPLIAVACTGGDKKDAATGTVPVPSGAAASSGMVAPNTFLTFEGARYRLADTLQANLVGQDGFTQVGTTREADIEFEGDLKVYRRDGDGQSLYTLSPATGEGERAVPALWLRWMP
ncbi:MAG: hypothetical protein HYX53_08395 [Chloroflexi bacterium]|nr:hypothetical protein [Chloroflexota bacterium]